MGSLTCTQIRVHAIHTKGGQAQTGLHESWLGETEVFCSACPTKGSNPGSSDLNSDSLTTEPILRVVKYVWDRTRFKKDGRGGLQIGVPGGDTHPTTRPQKPTAHTFIRVKMRVWTMLIRLWTMLIRVWTMLIRVWTMFIRVWTALVTIKCKPGDVQPTPWAAGRPQELESVVTTTTSFGRKRLGEPEPGLLHVLGPLGT